MSIRRTLRPTDESGFVSQTGYGISPDGAIGYVDDVTHTAATAHPDVPCTKKALGQPQIADADNTPPVRSNREARQMMMQKKMQETSVSTNQHSPDEAMMLDAQVESFRKKNAKRDPQVKAARMLPDDEREFYQKMDEAWSKILHRHKKGRFQVTSWRSFPGITHNADVDAIINNVYEDVEDDVEFELNQENDYGKFKIKEKTTWISEFNNPGGEAMYQGAELWPHPELLEAEEGDSDEEHLMMTGGENDPVLSNKRLRDPSEPRANRMTKRTTTWPFHDFITALRNEIQECRLRHMLLVRTALNTYARTEEQYKLPPSKFKKAAQDIYENNGNPDTSNTAIENYNKFASLVNVVSVLIGLRQPTAVNTTNKKAVIDMLRIFKDSSAYQALGSYKQKFLDRFWFRVAYNNKYLKMHMKRKKGKHGKGKKGKHGKGKKGKKGGNGGGNHTERMMKVMEFFMQMMKNNGGHQHGGHQHGGGQKKKKHRKPRNKMTDEEKWGRERTRVLARQRNAYAAPGDRRHEKVLDHYGKRPVSSASASGRTTREQTPEGAVVTANAPYRYDEPIPEMDEHICTCEHPDLDLGDRYDAPIPEMDEHLCTCEHPDLGDEEYSF